MKKILVATTMATLLSANAMDTVYKQADQHLDNVSRYGFANRNLIHFCKMNVYKKVNQYNCNIHRCDLADLKYKYFIKRYSEYACHNFDKIMFMFRKNINKRKN
jgi:hypothetical protein